MKSLLLKLKKAGHVLYLLWGTITVIVVPIVAFFWRRASTKAKSTAKNGTKVIDVQGEVLHEKK